MEYTLNNLAVLAHSSRIAPNNKYYPTHLLILQTWMTMA